MFLVVFHTDSFGGNNRQPQYVKIGLALSGGGAKGIAHIPVLEMLDSLGIQIDVITGTSIGSVVGAFYSVGYTGKQIKQIVFSIDWDRVLSDKISRKKQAIYMKPVYENIPFLLEKKNNNFRLPSGLVTGYQLMKFLNRYLYPFTHIHQFDSLPVPFRCIATNIENGNKKVFSSGNLIDAIRASISIPSYFTPWEIDDSLYVDGGLVANNPVEEAFNMGADIVLAVDISAPLKSREQLIDAISILDQSTSLSMVRFSKKELSKANFVIRPDIKSFGVLDFRKASAIYDSGWVAVKKNMWIFDSLKKIRTNSKKIKPSKSIPVPDPDKQLNIRFLKYSGPPEFEKEIYLGMHLDEGTAKSIHQLENYMDRLYGTGKFRMLTMHLEQFDPSTQIYILHVRAKPYLSSIAALTYNYSNYFNLEIGALFLKPVFINPSMSLVASVLIGEKKIVHGSLLSSFFRNSRFMFGFDVFGSSIDRPITDNNKPLASFREDRLLSRVFVRKIIGNAALYQISGGLEQYFAVPQVGNISITKNSDIMWRGDLILYVDQLPDHFTPSVGYSLLITHLLRKSTNTRTVFQKLHAHWQLMGPKFNEIVLFHRLQFGTTLNSPASYINRFYIGSPDDFSGSHLYYQNLEHFLLVQTGFRLPAWHNLIAEPSLEFLFSYSQLANNLFRKPVPGISLSIKRKFFGGNLNVKIASSRKQSLKVWLSFGYDLNFMELLMP